MGKEDVKYNYVLSSQALPNVDNCSDLGIIVDKDLSFVQHMTKIVSKAKARCSLLLKCFVTCNVGTLVKAFKVYATPLLEYNCAIWSPYFKKDKLG